jgi:branched-chain amino acid transport system substrate-binding protein
MRPNRRRHLLAAIAPVFVVFLVLMGLCEAIGQKAAGEPYKIGVTYPLSGPLGAWGQLLVPAVEIAVQQVNEAGGVNGRPLTLVIEDSKGNPEGAVSAMRKVVQVDRVAAILTMFTNVVSAQMPLTDELKVPLLSSVETAGLVAKSEWAFAHAPLLSRSLPLIAERWKHENVKRVFAFYPNTSIAKPSSTLVRAEAEKLGAQYDETLFKLGDTDFRGLITRAKSFNPDAIFIFGHGTPDEGVIMKQIRELGMTTQLYVGCGCVTAKSYREAAGRSVEGMIYAGFKYDPVAAKKLIDPYRAKLGFNPDTVGLEVYDSVFMIAEAIKKYGYSGDGIRRGLAELTNFRSIGGGLVSMGKDRQSLVPVALYQVKDVSKLEFVEINP